MGQLNPHDLLRLLPGARLLSPGPVPDWAGRSLSQCPFAVVRRGLSKDIPVGIRGSSREKRFACSVREADVAEVIRPAGIALPLTGPFAEQLQSIARLLDRAGIPWGPVGSVGFELATGRRCVGPQSDLDLLLLPQKPFSAAEAREILRALRDIVSHVDALVQAEKGIFSLAEFAAGQGPYLLKCHDGEALVQDPFASGEE